MQKFSLKKIIEVFTFRNKKELLAPVLWMLLSDGFSMVPSALAFVAVYQLGGAVLQGTAPDMNRLFWLGGALLLCFPIQYLLEMISYKNSYGRAYGSSAGKRTAYVRKLRDMPLGFFSGKESGELTSSFANDFANVEFVLCYYLPQPISTGILMLLCAVFLGFVNFPMMLAMFVAFPVSLFLLFFANRLNEAHGKQVLDAKAKAATQLNEYLQGMRVLKAYNQTGGGFTRLKEAYQQLTQVNIQKETTAGSVTIFCFNAIKFCVPIATLTGSYLVLSGSLSVLDFAGLIIVATKLMAPLMMTVLSLTSLRGMLPSGKRLGEVMGAPVQGGAAKLVRGDSYTFRDVHFSYDGKREILKDISFEVPPGKITALVGPSGSGKSTLLRLMARFWDIHAGSLRIGNQEAREIAPDSLFANISMVMQDTYLFRGTIRSNILFGNRSAGEEKLVEACKRACCHDFITALPEGYDTVIGEGGATLSGGERQRISIARALLKDAPILLLDEPTASLDADNEAMVQHALAAAARKKTVVMIAHRLKTVINTDQILVLEKGKIAERGTHTELLAKQGLYATLWNLQNQARELDFFT